MSDEIMLMIGDDGKAALYDDTYDLTIHCESEEEQNEVKKALESIPKWIPCSECEKRCRKWENSKTLQD